MYGIIASPDYAKDIKEVLQGKQILFEKTGMFKPEEFQQHCTAAAGISIDILIVDMTCCSSDNDIVKGIRKYRVARSSRVILIAPGREPGDPAISALVGDGVYDIVAPALPEEDDDEEEAEALDIQPYLQKQLTMSYHMGNAARWRSLDDEPVASAAASSSKPGKGRPETIIQEQIIFRDRIVGTVIVGVAAAGRRTGCTHTAVQISSFLAREGFSAACIELMEPELQRPVFSTFKSDEPSQLHPGGFRIGGIDFFPYDQVQNVIDILHAGYKYIVLDFGQLVYEEAGEKKPSAYSQEFLRSDFSIVTAGSALWDYKDALQLVDTMQKWKWRKSLNVLINYADASLFKEISEALTGKEKQTLQLQFAPAPYQPDPFKVTDPSAEAYRQILSAIIPAQQEKRQRGSILQLLPFGKRGKGA
ncbi:hypothetical protein [Paenibacillus validus]|uniref:hypothetical protein n=1 Tax=Paenibacillus validus TaxID=44253 RepID=UPI003D2D5746